MTAIPTYEQLAALPTIQSGDVTPRHLDSNGHMNVAQYFHLGDQTLLARLIDLGLGTGAGPAADGTTTFIAEHHLRYLAELESGDQFTCHTLLIARSSKALHAMSLVLDRTQQRLAFLFEAMVIHVSLETRRAVPFGPDVATALDAIAADTAHPWQAPIGGAIRIRGANTPH